MSDGLARIRATLDVRPPYCSGTCEIAVEQSTLFYSTATSGVQKINLLFPMQNQLESLHEACQLAACGHDHGEVPKKLRAGRLDATAFATQFSLGNTGLVDAIGQSLLEGMAVRRDIRFELYELNIYGAGSFVGPHQSTTNSDKMFGFLDIVFPTPHTGGIYSLRDNEREWRVDFATMLSEAQIPLVGYAAYFNEVEREIGSVISGHRLTLSYKLYFASGGDSLSTTMISALGPFEPSLKTALAEFVNDPKVLPNGGYLGFGLRHRYPVSSEMRVDTLRSCLKGSDAIITRVLNRLPLPWSIRVLYRDRGSHSEQTFVLHKSISDLSQQDLVWSHWGASEKMGPGAEFVRFVDEFGNDDEKRAGDYSKYSEDVVDIIQMTEMPSITNVHSQYLAYGNEVKMGNLYGDICIVAEVPAKVLY
ncbi:hypothetical protein DFJ58DRAFT_669173 [Suillus subalutaceus]|uniref:uncharacterized protein n=1 Tax=Suillus subalutaceus TaxID=48586 RepID=UPI001B86C06E|nr:uncharacterized protein DFJ58DRAFT_669173 [Suillus subalutaceus]KAG1837036.1 hypothetical protein DFJ58DRAFT_669173 [Suillus subalutaceus]